MELHLHSTTRVVEITGTYACHDGEVGEVTLRCRVWEGTADDQVPVVALIPRVAVPIDADQAQFQLALEEHQPPTQHGTDAFPARLVL